MAHSPATACGTLPRQRPQPPTERWQKFNVCMTQLHVFNQTTTELYLLSWTSICSSGEREEHRVTQEVQIRLKAWHTQACPQINRQAALNQCADQMAEASGQWVLLTARFNLIQLHLKAKKVLNLRKFVQCVCPVQVYILKSYYNTDKLNPEIKIVNSSLSSS